MATTGSDASSPSPDDSQRIDRLEENLAFTDHALGSLSEEMAALSSRLREAMMRVQAIEDRLGIVLSRLETREPE